MVGTRVEPGSAIAPNVLEAMPWIFILTSASGEVSRKPASRTSRMNRGVTP
jgi:hypothetical protein